MFIGRMRRRVTVHVTFIKVGEINTLKEAFDADVLIRSTWREPLLDKLKRPKTTIMEDFWNPKIFIENAIGEPKVTSSLQVEYEGNDALILERKRFKGTFMEQMELWEFPFDMQDLSVIVMSDITSSEVKLVEDPQEIHKIFKRSFIDEQEFYLYKYVASEELELQKDRADPFVRRCALKVHTRASRRPWYFVWNHFAITFLIACLAFLTFAVPDTLPQNRLQLAFTLILTNVAFKFVIAQTLPRISYLTYMDRYVLATMITLASVCIYHAMQTMFNKNDYPDKDYYALVVLGGLYFTYNAQFLVRLFLVPLKRRREMINAEAKYTETVKSQAIRRQNTKNQYVVPIAENTPLLI